MQKLTSFLFDVRNGMWFAGVERVVDRKTRTVRNELLWSRVKSSRAPLEFRILSGSTSTGSNEGSGSASSANSTSAQIEEKIQVQIAPDPQDERLWGLLLTLQDDQLLFLKEDASLKQTWDVFALSSDILKVMTTSEFQLLSASEEVLVKKDEKEKKWPLYFNFMNDEKCLMHEPQAKNAGDATKYIAVPNTDHARCAMFLLAPTTNALDKLTDEISEKRASLFTSF